LESPQRACRGFSQTYSQFFYQKIYPKSPYEF
jgi:hypothetical protein